MLSFISGPVDIIRPRVDTDRYNITISSNMSFFTHGICIYYSEYNISDNLTY